MSTNAALLVAHRGASGHAPENTLAAFRLALEMKVDGIELDIHMSSDGELVVIHDPKVDRTTDGRGRVARMTYEQLRRLDAGSWFNDRFPGKARPEYAGQRIPSLHEVMDLVKARARLYIEIKSPGLYPANLQSTLLSVVRQHEMEDDVFCLSFNRRALRRLKSLDASTRIVLLISRKIGDPVKAAASMGCSGLAVEHRLVTPALCRRASDAGLTVSAWTVDRPADFARITEARPDSIMTNYPDRFAARK